MPDKFTRCGLSGLLSVMETMALRVPRVVGLKVTVMSQDWPATTLVAQLFVSEKSPGFVPAIAIPATLSVEFPVLVNVVVCGELLEFTSTLPKSRTFETSLIVPDVTVIVAEADLVVSATEVAVSVTVGAAGTVAGAV
jgi:hypothetical protein